MVSSVHSHELRFEHPAVTPSRELGAYEALWARDGMSFRKLSAMFRAHPNAVPSDFVSEAEAEKFAEIALTAIRDARIKHFGVRIRGAGEYPLRLEDAENAVGLLYFQGNWELTSSRCIAIVGTRKPSAEGVKRAARLTREFVRAGFTVVSGMAEGIDTVAHGTAIEYGGSTIAVLGTPITTAFPRENSELQRKIADQHLVISQIPIVRHSRQTWRGNRLFFPERNVTMSALTEATVIVEAGNTSGTLIQARHALQQRRKLFILDSCFRNKNLTWPRKFLDNGAIRVTDFEEIVSHLAAIHKD